MLRRSLVLPLLALSLLSACGGSSSPGAAAAKAGLPSVSGSYGAKPTFTFPTKNPPATLMSTVLHEGTGRPVAKGDLLVGDYLGQVWQGKVFDNSYDRKTPAGFVIGTGQVIPGWDEVLVGVKAGSRVLMTLPPAKGYGTAGNAQAGIKGTDTLVFVVDLVASYGRASTGEASAVVQKVSTPGITVTGAPGSVPALSVAKGARPPKAASLTVLDKGHGAPVGAGQLVVQYVATAFTGAKAGSTYTDGAPKAVTVSPPGAGATPFDVARGVPLGSRVLLVLPASSGQPAVAVVLDLVAQPRSAAAG